MRKKHEQRVDLSAEIERSREIEEILSWIESPKLNYVALVVRCDPAADEVARVAVAYVLSMPAMHVDVETGRESIRDALIEWAVAEEDGLNLTAGLARTLGVDADVVRAEVKQLLRERLPESIEGLHGEAMRMAAINGETDFATALVARSLMAHPEVADEAVQAVLDHRCVASVMSS